MSSDGVVRLTIDGKDVAVPAGTSIFDAAQKKAVSRAKSSRPASRKSCSSSMGRLSQARAFRRKVDCGFLR